MTLHDSNFVILDPLNLQNNTTKNSFRTQEILTMFREAYRSLKDLIIKTANQEEEFA